MESPEITTAAVVGFHRETPSHPSWTVSTNWTIAGGSMSSSVAVETSFFPLEDDDDATAKSPLIMYPSSPDCSPCEITVTFPEKYEVRQVYVRSTARFYEMYYAIKRGTGNEYLSTVRCGIAEREGQVLRAVGVEEVVLSHRRSSNYSMSSEDDWVEVAATDNSQPLRGNVSPSKDRDAVASRRLSQDLYEATADIADAYPCTSFTLRLLSLVNKGCVCVEEVYIFADPIDEDNLDDQGSERNTSGNSLMAMLVPTIMQLSKSKALGEDSSNVLSSEKHKLVDSESKETDPTKVAEEIRHEDASSSSFKQEAKLPDTVAPVQLGISQHAAPAEHEHRKSTGQPEGILDHLVSRVNRIEDLLLRFEERMLKPLCNIDERLQRVEHQLEVLTKKTEHSGLISCTRISAPEFSCGESESNSFHNSGYMDSGYVARDDYKGLPPLSAFLETLIPVGPSKMFPALQVSAPEFSSYDVEDEDPTPETVEEAPVDRDLEPETVEEAPVDRDLEPETVEEAPVDRDLEPETVEEAPVDRDLEPETVDEAPVDRDLEPETVEEAPVDRDLEPETVEEAPVDRDLEPETVEEAPVDRDLEPETVEDAPFDRTVCAVSIDDALASALAGFLTSVPSKAPEFSAEDKSANVASASPKVDPHMYADASFSRESERMQEYLSPTASNSSSLPSDECVMVGEGGESSFCNVLNIARSEDVGADHIVDDVANGKAEMLTGNILDPGNTGSLEDVLKDQTADGTAAIQEIAILAEPVTSADITECGSSQDTIDNIVGFAHFASIPNYFDAHILDVKFVSHETLNTKSSLEALLSETSDMNVKTPAVDEVGKDVTDLVSHETLNTKSSLEALLSETSDMNVKTPAVDEVGKDVTDLVQHSYLIQVEDWGTADGLITVDMNYYSVQDAPRDAEVNDLEDTDDCSIRQEISVESLI